MSADIRATPWAARLLTAEDRAQIAEAMPEGLWVMVSGKSEKGPFTAVVAGPDIYVGRASSGLPVVACLRALGVEA